MVFHRFSICQDCAAPLEIVSMTFWDIEVGALGEMQRLGEALDQSADADLVDHLGELARA